TLPGTTVVSGNLDTQNPTGTAGDITVLGQNIALFNANLEASGIIPGTVHIGGEYRGEGSLPTAQRTLIDAQTTISSNGLNQSNGGRVIVWADDVTGFAGRINAYGGEGGFVEVSGKETLVFRGFVDAGAGTILLDPKTITISNNPSSPGVAAKLPNIFANDFSNQDITINRGDLENLMGAIFLQATAEITLLSNVTLNLNQANSLTLVAPTLNLNGEIRVDNITLIGNSIDINKLQGSGIAYIETLTAGRSISIGGTNSVPSLDLSVPDLNQVNGFQQLVIGSSNGTSPISLERNNIFNVPTLLRSNNLTGPNQNTTWTFTGANSGTISGFNSPVTFTNVNSITAGNQQDQLVFNNNVAFNGFINAGGGIDTLDYSNYTRDVNINLNVWSLLINNKVSNVEAAIAPAGYNNTLTATNQTNNWQLQGTNAGTVNNFAFQNFNNLVGGNSSDTFTFADQAKVQGIIDGGSGFDRVDYTAYTTPVTVNLANNQATGTQGAFNIESAQLPSTSTLVTPSFSTALPPGITTLNHNSTVVNPNNARLNQNLQTSSNLDFIPPNAIASNVDFDLANRDRIGQLLNNSEVKEAVVLLDDLYSSAFADYLNQSPQNKRLTYTQIQQRIQEVAAATNTRPGIIYTFIQPQHLDLILVPLKGNPLHYQIETATPEALQAAIQDLQYNILHPTRRRSTDYLTPAQQLYNWIITPLKSDLERLGMDTLLFSLDVGLRTLPLATLHDGEQFIIENYRLSLIPSLYWADFHYTDARQGKAIAMGISEFTEQRALPAVPAELEAIASDFNSEIFYNDAFTFNNLEQQTQQPAINIVHLATHGQFLPGEAENSYIQLWDRKLTLPEMGKLQWGNSGVDLLVLSACRTALGDPSVEYGFAGLGIQTGVDSVVASLWYASDIGTLALMSEFYNRLETNALKSEALRQAQLALIHSQVEVEGDRLVGPFGSIQLPETLANVGDRDFEHPYYWAGFSLIGSPW
ncbi:MAG: CHAT domain-containing protein, partial [Jaaginema sp. PMC 1080.18]|nr:CHAT domain-containing protein [Jaaginema sp. PMC 1080.18]